MPGEEHRIAAGPRGGEHLRYPFHRPGSAVRQLPQHTGLHVIDDEGHRRRIAGILERLGDVQAETLAHDPPPRVLIDVR